MTSTAKRVYDACGFRYPLDGAPFVQYAGAAELSNVAGSLGSGVGVGAGVFGNAVTCGVADGYLEGVTNGPMRGPNITSPFARFWGGRVIVIAAPDTSANGEQVIGCWSPTLANQRWRLLVSAAGDIRLQVRRSGGLFQLLNSALWDPGDTLHITFSLNSDGLTTGTTLTLWVTNITTVVTTKSTSTSAFYMQIPGVEPSFAVGYDQQDALESDFTVDDIVFWNSSSDALDDAVDAWFVNNGAMREVPITEPIEPATVSRVRSQRPRLKV